MRDVDADIRSSLERLTDPHGATAAPDALWGDLVARRRRRRNRIRTLAALPLLLVGVLAVGVLSVCGSDGDARSDVAAGGDVPLFAGDVYGEWHVAAIVRDGERAPTVLDATVTIEDEQGDPFFKADDGCGNGLMGALAGQGGASLDDLRLSGCDDEQATEQSQLMFGVLLEPTGGEIRGGELWLLGAGGDALVLTRDDPASETSTGTLRVRNIQVFGNGPRSGGTERAVIVFNEPLPVGGADYVADITAVEAGSGMVWTAQGPNGTHLCDSRHSVPEGAVGSVDLLVPASWFADGEDAYTGPELETIDDHPAKFPICGPHNGFIQYAMWSPLSADPAEVFVTVSPDRMSLNVTFAGTARSASEVESYDDLRDHLSSLGDGLDEDVLPEVVVPVRPPEGWSLETGGGSFPPDGSAATVGFDYIDSSSTRQPLPAVYVCTSTLPEPEACATGDESIERRRVTTDSGAVGYVVGPSEDLDAWSDVEWTTIATRADG